MTRKVKNVLDLGNRAKFSTARSICSTEETELAAKFSAHLSLETTKNYQIGVEHERSRVAESALQRGLIVQWCK